MLLFLSEAAVAARGDYTPDQVAAIAGVGWRTVRRFEEGKHWPQRLDQILSAYAYLAGLEDPRQLWQQALDDWQAHGAMMAPLDEQGRRIAEAIKPPARPKRRRAPAADDDLDDALSGGEESERPATGRRQSQSRRRGR